MYYVLCTVKKCLVEAMIHNITPMHSGMPLHNTMYEKTGSRSRYYANIVYLTYYYELHITLSAMQYALYHTLYITISSVHNLKHRTQYQFRTYLKVPYITFLSIVHNIMYQSNCAVFAIARSASTPSSRLKKQRVQFEPWSF